MLGSFTAPCRTKFLCLRPQQAWLESLLCSFYDSSAIVGSTFRTCPMRHSGTMALRTGRKRCRFNCPVRIPTSFSFTGVFLFRKWWHYRLPLLSFFILNCLSRKLLIHYSLCGTSNPSEPIGSENQTDLTLSNVWNRRKVQLYFWSAWRVNLIQTQISNFFSCIYLHILACQPQTGIATYRNVIYISMCSSNWIEGDR